MSPLQGACVRWSKRGRSDRTKRHGQTFSLMGTASMLIVDLLENQSGNVPDGVIKIFEGAAPRHDAQEVGAVGIINNAAVVQLFDLPIFP